MAGRKLNGQQRNAMFMMRHRRASDLRALASSGVSEAELEDLADDGYVTVSRRHEHRSWSLTAKGNRWVDAQLSDK